MTDFVEGTDNEDARSQQHPLEVTLPFLSPYTSQVSEVDVTLLNLANELVNIHYYVNN